MLSRTLTLIALLIATAAPAAGSTAAPEATIEAVPEAPGADSEEPLTIDVVVAGNYLADRIEVPAGRPVVLRFLRVEYTACTREVVFPTLGLHRRLPASEPVLIELGPMAEGEIPFHCGMHRIHGTVVAAAQE